MYHHHMRYQTCLLLFALETVRVSNAIFSYKKPSHNGWKCGKMKKIECL